MTSNTFITPDTLDDEPSFEGEYYALRLTPYPNNETTIREAFQALPRLIGETNYCYGKEYSKNHHIHVVFNKSEYDKTEFRDSLYLFLKETISNYDETKKGNTVYSITPVKSLERSVMYACKDQNVVSDGDVRWLNFVAECKKKAFGKPLSIKELMDILYLSFERDELTERTLWIELAYGRAQFQDQKTRYHDIDAYVETFKIKKFGKEYVQEVWENRELRRNNV